MEGLRYYPSIMENQMPKKKASDMNIGNDYIWNISVAGFPEIRGGAVIIMDLELCCLYWGPHLWELEFDCLPLFSSPEKPLG